MERTKSRGSVTPTQARFEKDINEIALALIEAHGLSYEASGQEREGMALYRWQDYRLRHITSVPRKVKLSSRFPVAGLPDEVMNALDAMRARFENGEDINPYQSKTKAMNDVSAVAPQRRTDGLWADWGIHHFHLTTEPLAPGEHFSARSDWLLFARVCDDVVAFIDVRHHGEHDLWSQQDLINTFIDSWPEQSERWRISLLQMVEPDTPEAPSARKQNRESGVNQAIWHKGEAHLPLGRGVTAHGTSVVATDKATQVIRNSSVIANWLDHPENPVRVELRGAGILEPEFQFAVGVHGLVIGMVGCSDRCWIFPDSPSFCVVRDTLLPEWALPRLVFYLNTRR